jgi:hypothetical protein
MHRLMGLAVAAVMLATGAPASAQDAGLDVAVTRDGDRWTAEYALDRDAPVWAFFRSALVMETRKPWRLDQWRVMTPGVVLERVGHYDVLRALDGWPVPRRVEIAFTPKSENLEADYGVLAFTDGSVALPSGQFDVFPLQSLTEAAQVPADLNGYPLAVAPAMVTWRDRAGPVLFRGSRVEQAVASDAQTYVLFGQAGLVEGARMTTVIDPELPVWISEAIEASAPPIIDYYTRRLGAGETDRPTVMISWRGPTSGVRWMGGSVLPGLIVMTFEGDRVVQPSPATAETAQWFVGHESAHFWLGQTVRQEFARDAWITEGGSDLMAIRALQSIDPAYAARSQLQRAVDECVSLADDPVAEANVRGEHRAYYACGAMFALAAEAAQKRATGGDWFDFLKVQIDANRGDGVLSRAEWLAGLTAVSGDPSLAPIIERVLDQGAADPAGALAELFGKVGVAHRMESGRIILD